MVNPICYKHLVPIGTDRSLVRDDMFIEKLSPKDISPVRDDMYFLNLRSQPQALFDTGAKDRKIFNRVFPNLG